MEFKTYTPDGLKFVYEKIEFKILHYIQHNFICQCPGLSKDQISMFKSLPINYFILKYHHTFYWLYKGDIKVGAANVLLKLNYL